MLKHKPFFLFQILMILNNSIFVLESDIGFSGTAFLRGKGRGFDHWEVSATSNKSIFKFEFSARSERFRERLSVSLFVYFCLSSVRCFLGEIR